MTKPDETPDAPSEETPEQPAAETPETPETPPEETPEQPAGEAAEPEQPETAEPEQPEVAETAAEGPPAEESQEEPAEAATEPQAEETPDDQPKASEEAPADQPEASEETPAEQPAPADEPVPTDKPASEGGSDLPPGAHLEPDVASTEPAARGPETEEEIAAKYGAFEEDSEADGEGTTAEPTVPSPAKLARDARYAATGKRKSSVARVVLRPGKGNYEIYGPALKRRREKGGKASRPGREARSLEQYFPRRTLQRSVREPLESAGYAERMDVSARIHGGGVSGQAAALRHGIARALIEADPNLRAELKRRQFLTRDPRVKERKKAGLKKARKRPQFSKR